MPLSRFALAHVEQIKMAMGIQLAWLYLLQDGSARARSKKLKIDLVLDRADHIVKPLRNQVLYPAYTMISNMPKRFTKSPMDL